MSQLNAKTKRYTVIKNRLALIEPIMLLIVFAFIQVSGISVNIKNISANLFTARYGIIAAYAVFFGFVYYVATFYLNFYRGYIIEHRFGLSNQSLSNWIKDELKRIVFSLIVFLVFIEFLYLLLRISPNFWWLFISLGWVLFTIVLAQLAPILIIPLFFKYEHLGDNDLKKRLIRLAKRFGVKLLDVFKIKLSAKTKKANAALVGMGKTRRVLLGDTLLENYTKDEVEVVLAHELAHHKLAHIWKLVLFGGLSTVLVFFLSKLSLVYLLGLFKFDTIENIAIFPSIMFFLSLFGFLISPVQNAFSRRLERSADLFALKITRLPEAFISCMNKLARQNLADPAPSEFIEIMLYDHPPISKRIAMAKKYNVG